MRTSIDSGSTLLRHRRASKPTRALVRAALLALTLTHLVAPADATERFPGRRSDGETRIGSHAPKLELEHWLNGDPLEIDDLLGGVALVRWWTDTCPFCSTSAPAINALAEEFGANGLTVVGIFHPKPPGQSASAIAQARRAAKRFDFGFSIGVDADWSALRRWWLDHEPGWTSVTFVVDRKGIIRWVHPGGEYHPPGPLDALDHWDDHTSCHQEYDELRALLRDLIAEPAD